MAAQRESEMPRFSGFYDLFILWLFRDNLKCQGSMVSMTCLFYCIHGCSERIWNATDQWFLSPIYSMAAQGESDMPRISGFYGLFILWLRRENLNCQGSVVSMPFYSMAAQGESEMQRSSGFYALFILWLFRENQKCQGSVISMPCLFYGCSGRIGNAKDQWFLCPVYSMAVQGESEMLRIRCFSDLFILYGCAGRIWNATDQWFTMPCLFYGCYGWNATDQWVSMPCLFYGCAGRIWNATSGSWNRQRRPSRSLFAAFSGSWTLRQRSSPLNALLPAYSPTFNSTVWVILFLYFFSNKICCFCCGTISPGFFPQLGFLSHYISLLLSNTTRLGSYVFESFLLRNNFSRIFPST